MLNKIFDDCGLVVQRHEQVHGGDINNAYCLFASQGKYFLKVNNKDKYPLMFEKEARGLDLLRKNSLLTIPQVIKHGESDSEQYLVLEWIEKGSPSKNMWEDFGAALALMHQQSQHYFGSNEDNYIGSLRQKNTSYDEWHLFYAECRIMPLVKILFDTGNYTSTDTNHAISFCKNIKNNFPIEPPALLHGDLWAGNFMVTSSGSASIFDPAVYFGHREMDIGMTKLFGGFDQQFYKAYNEAYPLEKHWEKRSELTQLYPLLVHAVLFGGYYVAATKNIISKFRN
jgi:protein-ribulosamine 3-kinase